MVDGPTSPSIAIPSIQRDPSVHGASVPLVVENSDKVRIFGSIFFRSVCPHHIHIFEVPNDTHHTRCIFAHKGL